MYCKNCGTMLDDKAKFCFGCGAQVGSAPSAPKGNTQTPYTAPKKAPKKKKGGLVALVAIVAVVAIAAAALAFSGLLGSDSVKLAAALAKSGKAFTDAVDKMELTDLSSLNKTEKVSEEFSIWIDEINGITSMSGVGYRVEVDTDMPGRKMDMTLTPYWGSVDLLSLQMKLADAEFYLNSPELTGDTFYMVNTETFCQDLQNMGADLGDAANVSFNIFDIAEQFRELNAGSEEMSKAIKEGATKLLKEIEVEKTGTKTLDVNGNDLKCTVYDVMIPEIALHIYLTSIEDAYKNVDATETYIQILKSIGFPDYVVEEMESAMADPSYSVDAGFAMIHDALENLGNIQLTLYVNDGYVVSAVYENNINGMYVLVTLHIGGGDNYVDNICLRIFTDEEGYRITSTGNHAGNNNVFTDVTVLEYLDDEQVTPLIQLDTTYAPKEVEDNFSFLVKGDGAALELQGQLTCDKDFMNLYLNKIAVSEFGENLAVLGMEFSIGKYEGESITVGNYKAFADMTEDDLEAAATEISKKATSWVMNLDADILSKVMAIASDYGIF